MTDTKTKIKLAKIFCTEVMEYFDGMPCLTDDEESIRSSAEWTLEKLNEKED